MGELTQRAVGVQNVDTGVAHRSERASNARGTACTTPSSMERREPFHPPMALHRLPRRPEHSAGDRGWKLHHKGRGAGLPSSALTSRTHSPTARRQASEE